MVNESLVRLTSMNRILALLFTILIVVNNSFFISIQPIYYGSLVFLWIVVVLKQLLLKKVKFSFFILFYLCCLLSIIVNDIPSEVQVYSRFLIFFILTTLLGPFFYSSDLAGFRCLIYKNINNVNIVICALSFLLWITGIHQGQMMNLKYNVLRPDFAGLYNHSMVLGPMSGIAILYCFYLFYTESNRKKKIFLVVLIMLCFLSCLKAGSRNAILGLAISLPFIYYKFNGDKISKLFLFIVGVIIILILTFPLYESSLVSIIGKFEYGESQGSALASRDSKWTARLQEFKDSPLFGVGYANVTHERVGEQGQVEPGSSWLSILSMTGLFGFVVFIINYLKIFVFKIKLKGESKYFYLILSQAFFLSIYMVFEGVIMFAGTFMSAFIWLTFGLLTAKRNN